MLKTRAPLSRGLVLLTMLVIFVLDSVDGRAQVAPPSRLAASNRQEELAFLVDPLPAPLYYIDGATGQIMRVEPDGVTLRAITQEPQPVTAFDVSLVDGRLIYVSNNMLIEATEDGLNRQVKFSAPPVTEQRAPYDRSPLDAITTPRISPDGQQVAFGYQGINLAMLGASRTVTTLLASDPYVTPPDGKARFYQPNAWSPDGAQLLVDVLYYWEGSAFGVLSMKGTHSFIQPQPAFCCEVVWGRNATELFAASPVSEFTTPGLWRVDPRSGVFSSPLLGGSFPGALEYRPPTGVRFPHVLADGSVLAFLNRHEPEFSTLLTMYRIKQTGANTTQRIRLRHDESGLLEARWSPGGEGAVIVQWAGNRAPTTSNPLLWLPADGGPALTLPGLGWQPRWGVALPPPPATGLLEQAQRDLADWFTREPDTLTTQWVGYLRAGNGPSPLWLVYTVGPMTFVQQHWPLLALYTRDTSGWSLLGLTQLEVPVEADNSPILAADGLKRVLVAPGRLWFTVRIIQERGASDFLVSYGPAGWRSEWKNARISEYNWLGDLDGDGIVEVLDINWAPGPLCSGCKVTDAVDQLARWNGSQFTPITLTQVLESASLQVRPQNDRALTLAKAGLWLDAWNALSAVGDLDPGNEALAWNARYLQLVAEARQTFRDSGSGNALYGYLWAGDFSGAVELLMRRHTLERIFNQEASPLLDGIIDETAESDLREQFIQWVIERANQAIDATPASAYPYFLRAWARHQRHEPTATILADLVEAHQRAPYNDLFADALAYLRGEVSDPAAPQLTARVRLNVRQAPGTQQPILGQLTPTQAVEVVGKLDLDGERWWQIRYPPQSAGFGWVSGKAAYVVVRRVDNTPDRTYESSQSFAAASSQPGAPHLVVRTLLVAPGEPGRLYALLSDQALHALPASNAQLVISDDFGATWTPFGGGLPVADDCLVILNLDYATPDALYASTCQGVYRWDGAAWRQISERRTGMIAVVYGRHNELWATEPFATAEPPLLHSEDGGQNWRSIAVSHFNGVANIAVDPRNGQTAYAIIWPKYGGSYFRRGTANTSWEVIPTPANNSAVSTGMALDGGGLYIVSGPLYNQIWRTTNADAPNSNEIRWELWYDFGDQIADQAELLAAGWSPQGLALYANVGLPGEQVLHRSLDGGKSWDPLLIPVE